MGQTGSLASGTSTCLRSVGYFLKDKIWQNLGITGKVSFLRAVYRNDWCIIGRRGGYGNES